MRTISTMALPALLLTFLSLFSFAQQKSVNPKPQEEPLTQLIERQFAHWDRDHNDVLDLVEIDHVIENHNVHGRQAALIVSLRYHVTDKNNPSSLPHKQLLKLAEERDFIKTVQQTVKRLETIERELFLSTDPDLATFHQGRLNDCYLLAAIAAQAHRSPKAIHDMIHPEVTGGFQIVYGDGQKIHVTPLTDSELLLGAKLDNRHGSWLAVLEKSYGIIRKHERAKKGDKSDKASGTVPTETLNYGDSKPIIALLTGHQADALILKSSHLDQVHNHLADMIKKKRLLCVGKGDEKAPSGIVNGHLYAILGYDVQKRHVLIFNPWGNNFTPKGSSGRENGYITKNGQFAVPLDEFHAIFNDVLYETDRPVSK